MASGRPSKSKKQTSVLTTVSDFTILPLTLPTLPGLPEQYANAKHYLYVKQHEPSHPTASAERSLFLANVPVDASESNIRALFADQLGGSRVEQVEFDTSVPAQPSYKRWKSASNQDGGSEGDGAEVRGKKRKRDADVVAEGVVEDEDSRLPRIWARELRKSGGTAVVVFVDKRSARGALKEVMRAVKDEREIRWIAGEGLGVDRYKSHIHLQYPPPSSLHTSMNAYLSQFNQLETLRNKVRKHQRSVPDEEGFITVTRGGRSGPARLEEAEKKKEELEERRKKNGVKDDFYRFQNREKRKEEEIRLKKAFEADRKRVQEMRERRGRIRPES